MTRKLSTAIFGAFYFIVISYGSSAVSPGDGKSNSSSAAGADGSVKRYNDSTFLNSDKILQSQICPGLTTEDGLTNAPNLVDLYPISLINVNLPVADSRRSDFPCNFKIRGYGHVTNIGVRAIYRSSSPWNFSKSSNCDSFVKFRSPPFDRLKSGEPSVICRIWKHSLGRQNVNMVHPILWYGMDKNLAISFKSRNHHQAPNDVEYLQLVFTISSGDSCSITVQQYLIDVANKGCNTTVPPEDFKSCGTYKCSDNIHLMNERGSWTYINWGTQNEFDLQGPKGGRYLEESSTIRRQAYLFQASSWFPMMMILLMLVLGYKLFWIVYTSHPPPLDPRRLQSVRGVGGVLESVSTEDSGLYAGIHGRRRPFSNTRHQGHGESNRDWNETLKDDPPPDYDSLGLPTYAEATKL